MTRGRWHVVAVLVGIIVWNEFFIALFFLVGRNQTVPVALFTSFQGYVTHWNLILAGIVPMLAGWAVASAQSCAVVPASVSRVLPSGLKSMR